MSDTPHLGLPLVQPSQAQKHVTVNEAIARLDGLTQLTILSDSLVTPPVASEGDVYMVPDDAEDGWAGHGGELALFLNGGWAFLTPRSGWRAWIADAGAPGMFDGTAWVRGTGAVSPHGAAMTTRCIEVDHDIVPGDSSDTAAIIPSQAMVFAVTGRVIDGMTGAAATWRLGIGGVSDDRYGSGLGLSAGSWVRGVTSSPLAYYAPTALTITGEGGGLTAGRVRLAVHVAEFALPRA